MRSVRAPAWSWWEVPVSRRLTWAGAPVGVDLSTGAAVACSLSDALSAAGQRAPVVDVRPDGSVTVVATVWAASPAQAGREAATLVDDAMRAI